MGQQENIDCTIKRLSNGPKHHLFGFHDLIVSNGGDDKYLSLEVDTINRPPLPDELFGVGYLQNGQFIEVGKTTAMNYPQGARQQWVAGKDYFTVNNKVGRSWGTDLYDASNNKLADRFNAPTHMLSKNGRYSYGLDYSRLFRLGGYGYTGVPDIGSNVAIPSNSGITKMDMQTKEVELLVSVMQVAMCDTNGMISHYGHHYLTHLSVSPDSSRIAFLHRYPLADGGEMTRLMTVGCDGSNLRCLAQGFLSHFDWKDNGHIYIFGRANNSLDMFRNNPLLSMPMISSGLRVAKKMVKFIIGGKSIVANSNSFLMITDSEKPEINAFAKDIIPIDGHPMTCPADNDFCVNDTYPDEGGVRDLMLYSFKRNLRLGIGHFKKLDVLPDMSQASVFFAGVNPTTLSLIKPDELAFTRSGLHCDLHPRWNSKGNIVVFDSIHEGSRQIYCANVSDLLNKYKYND